MGQTYKPYEVDVATLHLWHLDETAAPVMDAALMDKMPLAALHEGATLPVAGSLKGLGGALKPNGGSSGARGGLFALSPATGTQDNVNLAVADPQTGAFTLEAVIKFDDSYDPSKATDGRKMEIISMDDEADTERSFQFRIVGATPTTPAVLQFANLRGTLQMVETFLPTGGMHALGNKSWFHVAVTYSGQEGTFGNVAFYWTKLDPAVTYGNQIGSATLMSDMVAVAGDFAIGNEGRGPADECFPGWIDEVRISNLARPAGEMMPARQDPQPVPASLRLAAGPPSLLSLAEDADRDGLPDPWEKSYFGDLSQGPSDNPDHDTKLNWQEHLQKGNPAVADG